MKSQNIAYIPQLDHLRLLAAMLVLGFHVFHLFFGNWQPHPDHPAWALVTEGHTGVSLFFVLSGFIFMTIALQGAAINYFDFIRNRFLRIFPLFLVIFFVAISVGRDEFRPGDFFYIFFSNLGKAPTSNSFVTGAAWTISLEFTFYLVFPFLARFVREQGAGYLLRLIIILAVVKVAAYYVSARPTHMYYSTLVGRFDQFLWGMLAACLWQGRHAWLARHGRWLLLTGSLLTFLMVGLQARHASFFLPEQKQIPWIYWGSIEAVLWSSIILGYLGARLRLPGWFERALERGGEWSFSIYMWHGLILFLAHQWIGVWRPFGYLPLDAMATFLLLLPLVLGFAALSFHTIERPFLGMRRRYRDASRP